MTYTEFAKTYNWMLKNYPQKSEAYARFDKPFAVCRIERFEKRGTKWIHVAPRGAYETECENGYEITGREYANSVDAVPWFRNIGGKEIVHCAYTYSGYIPVEVHSISPDRMEKVVRRFIVLK